MKEVSFNEHFDTLWKIAQAKGYKTHVEFTQKCGFPKQRFNDWQSGKQNLTARNFTKLLEGIGVDCEKYEKFSNKKFTPEQREECELRKWINEFRSLAVLLARDKSLSKKLLMDLSK